MCLFNRIKTFIVELSLYKSMVKALKKEIDNTL